MFNDFMLPGVPPVVFWLAVGLGIIVQGIGKSGFAGGVGILTIPLMMLVMPVDKVVASLAPLLILLDFNALYHHWHNRVWSRILEIYLPSLVGIAGGGLLWWWIGQAGVEAYSLPIKRMVGVIAIFFAVYIVAREKALHWAERLRPGSRTSLALSVAAGFTSAVAHSAGPIVSLLLYSQGLGKTLFVGISAWVFTFINLSKLPFYYSAGIIHRDVLWFGLCLTPLVPFGSWLGKWMHDRISERAFNWVIMGFVLLAGVQLISNFNLILWLLKRLLPLEA
jgi:uncharacterized membrane protein YfcA